MTASHAPTTDGADFGAGAVSEARTTDSYVARYGADGALRWAQTRGGSDGFDYGFQIGAAGEDAIVADYFGSTMIDEMVGPSRGGPTTLCACPSVMSSPSQRPSLRPPAPDARRSRGRHRARDRLVRHAPRAGGPRRHGSVNSTLS